MHFKNIFSKCISIYFTVCHIFVNILPFCMGKHWDFTQKYLKRILNVAQDRPYIYGPHIYIWHLGQILHLTSGPCLGCHLKSSAISAKPGPCLAHVLYASAGWMPAAPDTCQIWAKFVCWLGTYLFGLLLIFPYAMQCLVS